MMNRTDTTRQYARCCVCYDLIPEERQPGTPQFCGPECAAVHIQRLDDHYQSQPDAIAQTVAKLLDGPVNEGA